MKEYITEHVQHEVVAITCQTALKKSVQKLGFARIVHKSDSINMHLLGCGSHCGFITQYPVNQPKLQSDTVNVKTCVNVALYISMAFDVCPRPRPGS